MSGKRQPPRPRDRIIGARLRAIRKERTDLSLEAAAKLLGWGLATMSRIENGKRVIDTEEVAMMLTVYGIPADERRDIIAEARAENASGWWDRPLPGVPAEVGTLASYAVDADSLTDWAVTLVPGLLQIEDYAMALMLSDDMSVEVAELRWVARRRRQQILGTLEYGAYISETALRTPFGGAVTHRRQLSHLLEARDRGISVRVVPEHLPLGLISHSWLYLTFPNTTPVVNVEVAEGGVYLHDDQAEPYAKVLAKLDHNALSTTESQTKLRSILKEA
ncbi:putative DNA-binding protein [Actinokineospora spheciospongiae]|uniref:Putative DNA-binding protein n=1 Tax=Actinokineospora spheciospongiae TaxID=909613 RepID=W7ITL5_9PSEU|nr:helix-turn-helix transcriptional regulator [Actinokineospora spheciospongiae]EWC59736.1 putative DNA-binding protein [Actinokineospora spheciospongiae]PWW64756.1 helix-turn-helix protein [Actinokineospora spheciospongiae]